MDGVADVLNGHAGSQDDPVVEVGALAGFLGVNSEQNIITLRSGAPLYETQSLWVHFIFSF